MSKGHKNGAPAEHRTKISRFGLEIITPRDLPLRENLGYKVLIS